MIDAQRVPPSAWRTSQSRVIWRSPSALRSVTARRLRPIRRWISWVRPVCLPFAASRAGARVGRPRQHPVFGGDPALALAAQEGRQVFLDAGGTQNPGLAHLDQHRTFGMEGEVARQADGTDLVGLAFAGSHAHCPGFLGLNFSMVERISSIAFSISSSVRSVLCAGSRPNSSMCVATSLRPMVRVEMMLLGSST